MPRLTAEQAFEAEFHSAARAAEMKRAGKVGNSTTGGGRGKTQNNGNAAAQKAQAERQKLQQMQQVRDKHNQVNQRSAASAQQRAARSSDILANTGPVGVGFSGGQKKDETAYRNTGASQKQERQAEKARNELERAQRALGHQDRELARQNAAAEFKASDSHKIEMTGATLEAHKEQRDIQKMKEIREAHRRKGGSEKQLRNWHPPSPPSRR